MYTGLSEQNFEMKDYMYFYKKKIQSDTIWFWLLLKL